MSLLTSKYSFNDYELWKPLLMRFLTKNKWGRYYRKIFTNLKVVDLGMKPSFLWDVGPIPSAVNLKMLLSNLTTENLLQSKLFLFSLVDDIFIVNKETMDVCLSNESFYKIMDISTDRHISDLLTYENKTLLMLLKEVIATQSNDSNENTFDFSKLCCTKVFGIMLGYPVVYDYDKSHDSCALNFVPLINVKVFIGVLNDLNEIYSFSFFPNSNLEEHVDQWFDNLKIKFENYNLKISKESVSYPNVVL